MLSMFARVPVSNYGKSEVMVVGGDVSEEDADFPVPSPPVLSVPAQVALSVLDDREPLINGGSQPENLTSGRTVVVFHNALYDPPAPVQEADPFLAHLDSL